MMYRYFKLLVSKNCPREATRNSLKSDILLFSSRFYISDMRTVQYKFAMWKKRTGQKKLRTRWDMEALSQCTKKLLGKKLSTTGQNFN
jgi:hypothetical protein